jgi:hypothetical protein
MLSFLELTWKGHPFPRLSYPQRCSATLTFGTQGGLRRSNWTVRMVTPNQRSYPTLLTRLSRGMRITVLLQSSKLHGRNKIGNMPEGRKSFGQLLIIPAWSICRIRRSVIFRPLRPKTLDATVTAPLPEVNTMKAERKGVRTGLGTLPDSRAPFLGAEYSKQPSWNEYGNDAANFRRTSDKECSANFAQTEF